MKVSDHEMFLEMYAASIVEIQCFPWTSTLAHWTAAGTQRTVDRFGPESTSPQGRAATGGGNPVQARRRDSSVALFEAAGTCEGPFIVSGCALENGEHAYFMNSNAGNRGGLSVAGDGSGYWEAWMYMQGGEEGGAGIGVAETIREAQLAAMLDFRVLHGAPSLEEICQHYLDVGRSLSL